MKSPVLRSNDKIGSYIDMEVPGALPNGTKFVKIVSEDGDMHKTGSTGVIIGSVLNDKNQLGYFVNWDDCPDINVFIAAFKIKVVI